MRDDIEFYSETYVKSPSSMNTNNSVSLPIKLFAQLPPLKDHFKTVHHKVICDIYLEMLIMITNVF